MMEHPIVEQAVKGNADALEFLRAIAKVLHLWDDLVDRDKAIADATIHEAFGLALIDLPRNAFYRRHFEVLNAVLLNAIVNWRIATTMERNDAPDRRPYDFATAFILRSSYVDLLTMSATLIGGVEWGAAMGPEIHRWAHQEGMATYLYNLAAETAARKENDHVL